MRQNKRSMLKLPNTRRWRILALDTSLVRNWTSPGQKSLSNYVKVKSLSDPSLPSPRIQLTTLSSSCAIGETGSQAPEAPQLPSAVARAEAKRPRSSLNIRLRHTSNQLQTNRKAKP